MSDLSSTLLIIPCSGAKHGTADPGLPTRSVVDFLGADAARQLEEGRGLAFARTSIDRRSPPRPALATYSGFPYATPGFRDLVTGYLRAGLHCLIISGGYGLLRPEEPIHSYKAHIQQTRSVWRRRVPALLRDYVQRSGIERTFGVFSRAYAVVVPDDLTGNDWRAVPAFDRSVDTGDPRRVVPRKVGNVLVELLAAGFRASPNEPPAARPDELGANRQERPAAPLAAHSKTAADRVSAEDIRRYLIETYIEPARRAGRDRVGPLRAGDVHRELGLRRRLPLVCSVLDGRRLWDEARVELVSRTGPRQASDAGYTYAVLP